MRRPVLINWLTTTRHSRLLRPTTCKIPDNETRVADSSQPRIPEPHREGAEIAHPAGINPESSRYWKRVVAKTPPMTPEEIAAVGVILRRIDARVPTQRNQQPQPRL